MPNITFVDTHDNIVGYGTKAEALANGLIHRIVRIYIVNEAGELLIQKRSATVDVPLRWDQSAAGHVDEGEDYDTAAYRELEEEVGITDLPLRIIAHYYTEESDDNVIRKRFNTLYVARYSGAITKDESDVAETKWIQPDSLRKWMDERPQDFTQGFLQSYRQYINRDSNII